MFSQETFTNPLDGTEYTIQPPNIKTRGLFTFWLEEGAIAFLRNHKKAYGDDYLSVLVELTRKGGAKGFAWGTESWGESLNSTEGGQELAYLTLRQAHPDIDRKAVAEMWDEPAQVFHALTGEEIENGKLGTLIVQKIWTLINRPNSSRPEKEPGDESPITK